jgi:hypothetical protein
MGYPFGAKFRPTILELSGCEQCVQTNHPQNMPDMQEVSSVTNLQIVNRL